MQSSRSPLKRPSADCTTPSGRNSKRNRCGTPQMWEAQITQAIQAKLRESTQAAASTVPVPAQGSSSSQGSSDLSQSSSTRAFPAPDEEEQAVFWSGTVSSKVEGPPRKKSPVVSTVTAIFEQFTSQSEVSDILREPSLVPNHEEEPSHEPSHDATHLSAESVDVLNGVHEHIRQLERSQAALKQSALTKDARIRELEAENRRLRARQDELNDQITTMNDTIKIHQQVIKRSYMKPKASV